MANTDINTQHEETVIEYLYPSKQSVRNFLSILCMSSSYPSTVSRVFNSPSLIFVTVSDDLASPADDGIRSLRRRSLGASTTAAVSFSSSLVAATAVAVAASEVLDDTEPAASV